MNWTNYHSHSYLDDGKEPLEEYVKVAIKKKMYAMGFSAHSPVPFPSVWNLPYEKLTYYVNEVKRLKEKYKTQIKLFLSLEIDFIDKITGIDNWKKLNLDYTLAGIHYLKPLNNHKHYAFDGGIDLFKKGLNELFGGDIRQMTTLYYQTLNKMLETNPPDIISHFDVILKFNKKGNFLDPNARWYQKLVLESLELVKQKDCIIEVNTRGYFKKLDNQFYPQNNVIKKCIEMNIPLTISADAHHPSEMTSQYPIAAKLLLEMGQNEIFIFDEKGWHPVELTEKGLITNP